MEILYKGVDISKHNSINWNKVNKNEIDFVIIRAGYGFNFFADIIIGDFHNST